MLPGVIAIDGPAGSGKTVVGKQVADALGYLYLDTGAFYRALTWLALDRGADVHDGVALAALARSARIEIKRSQVDDGRPYSVLVDGQDVTRALSSPEVAANVSIVAAHAEVRAELLPTQRHVAQQGMTVMAGRDIGTVVCPFAELKFFLKAPLPIRVARRIQQLEDMGLSPDPGKIAAEMAERDRIDQSREVAPLRPATDAVVIDTSTMTVEEEVALILDLVARRDS
jgi:cytidylate kinase